MTTEVHRLTVVTEQTPARALRKRIFSVVAHVLLIGASILMLYPLLWMLSASFRPENEIFNSGTLWPSEWSLDAYFRGWNGLRVSFGTFFLNSFVISISAVIGNLLTCSLAAYAFARLRFAGRSFWFGMMLMTLMLPYQVTLIPQYVLFRNLGWIDTMLPLIVPKFLAVDAFLSTPSSYSSWCSSSAAFRANSTRRR
jgi:multiple sugar transport system permease protein